MQQSHKHDEAQLQSADRTHTVHIFTEAAMQKNLLHYEALENMPAFQKSSVETEMSAQTAKAPASCC